MHFVKKKIVIISLLFWGLFGSMILNKNTQAAQVKNLEEKKEYWFNLDGKGSKEKISFSMNSSGLYKINVNGKVLKKIKLGEWYYSPCMQIFDIDKKDGKMDIWVYAYADSEDIRYSALYEYSGGKINRVWNLTEGTNYEQPYNRGCGYISSTNGKGKFTVVMDRAVQNGYLTGNYEVKVVFKKAVKKVTQVTKNTFYFYKTYGSNYGQNGRWLKAAGKISFYKKPDSKNISFSIEKGEECYPVKMYIASGSKVYVMYKTKSGKKGWLCAEEYNDYANTPFQTMVFAD